MRKGFHLKANFKFKYKQADARTAKEFALALRGCGDFPIFYVAKKTNGVWTEQKCRTYSQDISPLIDVNTDCYVTVNDFSPMTDHRGNIGTTFINGLFFDTDFHDCNNSQADDRIHRCIDILDTEIREGNFPPFSMVTLTGRGLGKYIVYKDDIYIKDENRITLHKKVYGAIIRRLQGYWDKANLKATEDKSVTDFARVCRLPGTYNSKAKRYATLAYKDTKNLLTVEDVAQYFTAEELDFEEVQKTEYPTVHTTKNQKFEDCALRRKQFLERECDGLKEGENREIKCWLYFNTIMALYGSSVSIKMLKHYNDRFAEPLTDKELDKIIKETLTHGIYKFTEAKFYGYLGVSIPKKCAIRRHTKKEKEEIKAKKLAIEKKVCRMRKSNKTVEEIKKACNISRATVYKILKKHDLDKKIFKYEQSQKAPFSDAKMSTFAIYDETKKDLGALEEGNKAIVSNKKVTITPLTDTKSLRVACNEKVLQPKGLTAVVIIPPLEEYCIPP